MKLGTLFTMDSLEKRDSAITNAIFLIKIQYPTELNDLTNLFGCQLYSEQMKHIHVHMPYLMRCYDV